MLCQKYFLPKVFFWAQSSYRAWGSVTPSALKPHMEASLSLLRSSRAELAAATPNKGGHRARALGLIDQAIAEVRDGIAFAGN
jgi:hypothetical protein